MAGATLAPSTLSLIFSMFQDPRQRSAAIGVRITSFPAGGAIGPVLGGVLLARFWRGSVFLLAVPVMALLLTLGPRVLPEYRDAGAGRVDLPSVALSLAAVLAVVFGLKRAAQDGPDLVAATSCWGSRRWQRACGHSPPPAGSPSGPTSPPACCAAPARRW